MSIKAEVGSTTVGSPSAGVIVTVALIPSAAATSAGSVKCAS